MGTVDESVTGSVNPFHGDFSSFGAVEGSARDLHAKNSASKVLETAFDVQQLNDSTGPIWPLARCRKAAKCRELPDMRHRRPAGIQQSLPITARRFSISSIADLSGRRRPRSGRARACARSASRPDDRARARAGSTRSRAAFDLFDDHPETAAALAAASERARTLCRRPRAADPKPSARRRSRFAADALTGVMLESAWPHGDGRGDGRAASR